jgi:hypothetical protein
VNSKQEQRRELWRQGIAEQEKSGRPVSVFCRDQSLSEATFFAWRQRLKVRETPVSFGLVETKAVAEPVPPVELLVISGERLRIPRAHRRISSHLTVQGLPNLRQARTPAASQRWNAPIETSGNCSTSSSAHSTVCVRMPSTKSFST